VSPPRVELHIDELVLTGVAPHQRAAVVDAFRAELARAVRVDAAPPPVLPPERLQIDPVQADGAAVGAAAGRALARGLSG
jgi:hypothetical protein